MSNTEKTIYVLGFMFSPDANHVVLITKDHPEWQKGKLNGVGGKLNQEELDAGHHAGTAAAMVREFKEETSVTTTPDQWRRFAVMQNDTSEVYCFCCKSPSVYAIESVEKEVAGRFLVRNLFHNYNNVIPNINWLLPMALDEAMDFAEITNK